MDDIGFKAWIDNRKRDTKVISFSRLGEVFRFYCGHGYLWFKVLGTGLHFKDTVRNPIVTFSERYSKHFPNRKEKWVRIGKWKITLFWGRFG